MNDQLNIASEHPYCFVIFGASGDLAMRMLIPSLETIGCYKAHHPQTTIIGIARSAFKDEDLKEKLADGIKNYSRIVPETSEACETIPMFLSRFKYIQGGYDQPETYAQLREIIESKPFKGVIYYMATPPSLVPLVAKQLHDNGLHNLPNAFSRLVVEKPFGYDLKTSIELNKTLHENFTEENIYRIDHYLAKETVLNIFTFRWGNAIWEPLWNRNYVSHVELLVAEAVDVGTRIGYYENATVIRDMVQNHLLQILAITAMEPPPIFNSKSIRDEKMKVLNSIRPIKPEDVMFGQYHGFQHHEGVTPGATTPTFAIIRFYIDNWRWQGVPFFIITGKALNKKISTIKLVFKEVPHQVFGPNTVNRPNVLKIRIQPKEEIQLKQHVKMPGMGIETKQIALKFKYAEEFGTNALQGAYERVILDTIRGDQSFFPRSDEIDASWNIVQPILNIQYNSIAYASGMDVRYGTLKRGCKCQSIQNWFYDPNELVNGSAMMIKRTIIKTIKENGICRIALSGGSTPRPIYALLASDIYKSEIDYSKVHFFFADERCVAPDHADSNYGMIKKIWFDPAGIKPENVHRMKGELDPQVAAKQYADELLAHFGGEPEFDLLLLGMGPDGHIASLFPGTDAVFDRENYVISHFVPQQNANRISITPRVIYSAKFVVVLVSDTKKKAVLECALHGPYCPGLLPAQILRREKPRIEWNIYA